VADQPTVPFLDVGAAFHELRDELLEAQRRVMESGWYILGEEVAAFEAEYAAYCEAQHCVGVGNGLDALTLALRALGIGAGDEVIVPSNTYIATWLAVSAVGATPVPVEPDPRTHNIDPSRIAAALTGATRALLPVHLYGQPADLAPILRLARARGLAVIEDAAQAHGAQYQGKRIGAHGDVVCWSFYPAKNLGAFGDGGAITTDRGDLADRVRVLRNYGSSKKYVNEVRGVNSRLDELQAASLRVKLRHLDEWNGRRRAIAARYLAAFAGNGHLTVPTILDDAEPVWHLFVVRSDTREVLQSRLTALGVQTLVHYPVPPHRQAAYHADTASADLPIAELLAAQVLSLPMGPHLGEEQVTQVIEAATDALSPGHGRTAVT
jgi:dTDP-4-amino-4,6-dideoxygalactose transaminase